MRLLTITLAVATLGVGIVFGLPLALYPQVFQGMPPVKRTYWPVTVDQLAQGVVKHTHVQVEQIAAGVVR